MGYIKTFVLSIIIHYANGNIIHALGLNDSWFAPLSPELQAYYRPHIEIDAIHYYKCIRNVLKYVSQKRIRVREFISHKKITNVFNFNFDFVKTYETPY